MSYHRDLQETKAQTIAAARLTLPALDAFRRAFAHVHFQRDAMTARAGDGFTVATDLADAMIARGATARDAHRAVGERVLLAESGGRDLTAADLAHLHVPGAPRDAAASVRAKRTIGSTHPDQVRAAIAATRADIATLSAAPPLSGKEGSK